MGDVLRKKKKFSGAVFHYVQAAEKAVKGLLYLFNLQPWGHSLQNLLVECEKLGISIPISLKTIAKGFVIDYIASRYPDASPAIPPRSAYDKQKANAVRSQAKSFIDFVEQEKEGRVKP